MKKNFGKTILAFLAVAMIAGCSSSAARDSNAPAADLDARAFSGTIISLRPMRSTMIISKDEHHGKDAFPNEILVKYDTQTKFLMDGQPTTIDRISQYMTVDVTGRMIDGAMVAGEVNFSSVLPKNVRPAPAAAPVLGN